MALYVYVRMRVCACVCVSDDFVYYRTHADFHPLMCSWYTADSLQSEEYVYIMIAVCACVCVWLQTQRSQHRIDLTFTALHSGHIKLNRKFS